jgi:hypothetical protein
MRLAVGNDVLSSRLWQAGLKLWIEEDKSEYRILKPEFNK